MVDNSHGSHAKVGDLVQHLQPFNGEPIDRLVGVVYKIEVRDLRSLDRGFEKFVYTTAVKHLVKSCYVTILERA
tara:strand:- start:381 stop:602 length:222 start_codon:yes stop_codon:yes gene_type:complete